MLSADEIRERLDLSIQRICQDREKYVKHPKKDFTRNRSLSIEDTIKLLLSMEGGALNKELYKQGVSVSPSAFSQSRAKIRPEAFKDILDLFNHQCTKDLTNSDWVARTYCTYHVYAVDGSCINMAKNRKSHSYVQSGDYNQLHLNALYDIQAKIYRDVEIQDQSKADEIGALIKMLDRQDWEGNNLIILDRGYESYNLFAHLMEAGVDFLCRVKQDKSAMREIAKLPMMELDTFIEFTITTTQTNEDKEKGHIYVQTPSSKKKETTTKRYSRWDFPSPYQMKLRVVRTMLDTGEYETLVTTLSGWPFEMADIPFIYHNRWGIETAFRSLKYDLGLVNLHGKSERLVKQEIYAALIMSNLVSEITWGIEIPRTTRKIPRYALNCKMATFL